MPIVYQAPDEVSPQISGAYGAAEQWSHDFPALERQQAGVVSAQQHATALAAATRQQAAENALRQQQVTNQQAALAQQGELARAQMGEHAREAGAGRDLQAAQFQAGLQQQSAMAQQHAQLQDWVNRQGLSAHEQIIEQRMRNQVGEVLADQTIPADTKASLLFQLKTGLDAYAPRIQAAKAQAAQEQADMVHHAAAQQKTIESQNEEFEKQLKEKGEGVMRWADPHTGRIHLLIQNKKTGEWYNPVQAHGTGDGGAEKAQTQRELDARKEWQSAHAAAVKQVSEWAKEENKVGDDKHPEPRYPNLRNQDVFDLQVRKLMLDKGLGQTLDEHLARRLGGRQGGNVATPQQQPGAAPPAAKPAGEPFKAHDRSTMNEQQMLFIDETRRKIEQIRGRPDLSRTLKETAVVALEQARKLAEEYGSAERLKAESPKEYEALLRMNEFLGALGDGPPERPSPPPPPGANSRRTFAGGIPDTYR